MSSGPLTLEGLHTQFGDSSKVSLKPALFLNRFLLSDMGNKVLKQMV